MGSGLRVGRLSSAAPRLGGATLSAPCPRPSASGLAAAQRGLCVSGTGPWGGTRRSGARAGLRCGCVLLGGEARGHARSAPRRCSLTSGRRPSSGRALWSARCVLESRRWRRAASASGSRPLPGAGPAALSAVRRRCRIGRAAVDFGRSARTVSVLS